MLHPENHRISTVCSKHKPLNWSVSECVITNFFLYFILFTQFVQNQHNLKDQQSKDIAMLKLQQPICHTLMNILFLWLLF